MELIAVLRLLWRRRLLVLLGVGFAAAVAYALGPSPTPPRGFAQTKVMLDTSWSQLADGAADGAETLAWRASLAAQTLGTEENRRTIATAAGISLENLDITPSELVAPLVPASLPRAAVEAAYSSSKPFAIDTHTDGTPIITISANAPDRASATRLAAAAVTALEAYTSVPPNADRLALDVRTVAPIDSVEIPGGQGRKKMVAMAMILVCMWIAAVALMPVLLGGLRTSLRDTAAVGS